LLAISPAPWQDPARFEHAYNRLLDHLRNRTSLARLMADFTLAHQRQRRGDGVCAVRPVDVVNV
jgi:hypothetical protein